jgi:cytochrome c-type biogenesis protein CcmE
MKYGQFAVLMTITVGSLSFLACSDSATYYKTIRELRQMGSEAQTLHLRVPGDIQCNSITHIAGGITFNLVQDKQVLTVTYEGRDLPYTFREGAQALVDGHLGADGVFHASEIQAKSAPMKC